MIPVGGIINISGRIAEYFGLIEGVSTQVTKLVHQAFISAKDNLEYARTSSGQNQIDYIKQAKDRFIDAVAVEENENKILALVGLSMCQFMLGDTLSAQRSLERVRNVELTRAENAKYKTTEVGSWLFPWGPVASKLFVGKAFPSLKARRDSLENTKKVAFDTNRKLIT